MRLETGILILAAAWAAQSQTVPKLPIGMNIQTNCYYCQPIFLDAMKASGTWITFNAEGDSPWDTGLRDSLPADSNGYLLELPFPVGSKPQIVRSMLNDFYQGDYAVLHDGEGDLSIGGRTSTRKDGILHVELSGKGQNVWLNIHRSKKGNPVRNLRILPAAQVSAATVPTFHPGFLKGLGSMQALRLMDWMNINASSQKKWADKVKVSEYTQAGERGISIEYALELANLLKSDPWFSMPHQADDDYILRFSRLVKEKLHPSLKVYVEYSNEVWNWQFEQAHWIGKNAAGADPAISAALRQVGKTYCQDEAAYCHPEKDAHMMDRTFRLWRNVYSGADTARMVRVAAVQHAWYGRPEKPMGIMGSPGRVRDPGQS
ncbi:MAG: hypothetical protein M3Y08_15625 [Fibrobacterota bacterium]|nr:hypothetical protein [Fibrobacterota bacterium]